ncbi:ran-binding protein 9 isoform X2 [Hydra vulgaris]|uniref:ran-binding protein 9 isoform X2 n=1 Tax=Hydra vulgaris TaxID=6087 RepID=UPI001F5ED3AE|nr:ran-binding protein 9 isoform X2 [Hydra vulgaris]
MFAPDRISELYPHVNENETPLPRCWSSLDKYTHIGLSHSNLRAQYKGLGKTHKDAASVRTSNSIPAACGLYYFEIKIISKGRDGYIGIGLCTQSVNMNKLPGWEKDSYGYHADDGHSFCTSGAGEVYGPTFTTGDVIGCGVNLIDRNCFYTKNGVNLGIAFRDIIPNLFPTVGLQTPGEIVDVNFGQQPFVYDINEVKKEMQSNVMKSIVQFPVTTSEAAWQSIIQKVVAGYLVHYGYCSTVESFAKSTGQSIGEELISIRNRQKIQKLILSGRISEAIETIKTFFPNLLEKNPRLAFQLKCRQFIEMVSGCDGEVKPQSQSLTHPQPHSPNRIRSTPSSPMHSSLNASSSKNHETNRISYIENGEKVLHENGSLNNGNGCSDMIVDEYISNGVDHYKDSPMDEDNRPHSISVITSISKESVPLMRQLCGGNLVAIEKLLVFGKLLQNSYKEMVNASGVEHEADKLLLKDSFSLLAYNNPYESPVNKLLEPVERENIFALVNTAILENENLPGKPSLEVAIAQAKLCLKTMAKHGLGACAMVKVEDFFCEK